jgi:ubiquinone/menaquinone biosynthesis C-methylase UbiE
MKRLEKKLILRESWVWEKEVEDFMRERLVGYTLNVPCGASKLGDVRVDLDPVDANVRMADMKNLPFETNTFDTVISDPPWKLGFYDRFRQFFELVRVAKPDGRIILNAYWIPYSANSEILETWIKAKRTFTNTSIISISRKTRTETPEELAGRHDPDQSFLMDHDRDHKNRRKS